MKRLIAIAAAAAVAGLGCVACDDSSTPSSGAASDGDLSTVQSTLDSIQSDMAGDGQR
ncbi:MULTISPECIES: hypothetical protein [Amycolatopsis]|uniref:Uncharacterized protein n=1 Tax=Amycolatopsis rubida TaxID=112413 RepID=A0A1I5KP32_9PSEU|nr:MULTISPECIES: hypothetical protein [Amycolatopsis]OAP21915.1 hypothetical protein A4R44_07373 [Amycolatopsis sp. M39]SFO86301.1 hypothetical protein SAMN05421854_103266 [Amycolatopsis rubida]